MFDILEADIAIFQETKIQKKDLRDDMVLVPGWDCYFSLPKYKKGMYGCPTWLAEDTDAEGTLPTKATPASLSIHEMLHARLSVLRRVSQGSLVLKARRHLSKNFQPRSRLGDIRHQSRLQKQTSTQKLSTRKGAA